ncbi:MAG: hypothetical protein IPG71_03170 [bacterium]|nr:hypothetical protein [bacterium]
MMSGVRGERFLKNPIRWVVDFDPNRNYQIRLEEQAVIAQAMRWSIPATPKIGYWPIGHGKLQLGQDSYIEFREKIAG